MKCEICKQRKSVVLFSHEPTFAITHGFGKNICRQCYIEEIEKMLKKIKENLEFQKELLKSEGATSKPKMSGVKK